MKGSADPHVLQKHLLCRVSGKLNRLTLSSPETHFRAAADDNKLAAWADPVSLRQYPQWQR
jgi:hypothetical protein